MKDRLALTVEHAKTLRGASAVAALSLLAGCAGAGGRSPSVRTARIDVVASAMLNPTDDGRPSPVVLKLYELASQGDFDRARLAELTADAEPSLPGLVARATLNVHPGAHLVFERALDERTRALGVVAGYQRIDEAQWRASIELGRAPILALSIDVGACTVALDEDKDARREANRGAISRWVVPVWRKIENLFGGSEAQK